METSTVRAEQPADLVADQPQPTSPRGSRRLAFIDNLRVFLTVLVILHHAGQPYGPTGGQWPIMHAEKFRLLGPFFHVNASYFMGLFFLISGYFLPPAYEHKGAAHFLRDRFRRLGIPVLIFALGVYPLMEFALEGKGRPFFAVWMGAAREWEWAHLWFLGHLLVYAIAYAGYRKLRPAMSSGGEERRFPGNRVIVTYAVLLALVSVVVRIWYPIDRWVGFVVPSEVAHLPQYASLFLFGLIAARYRWLERIPVRTGRLWLTVGLTAIAGRFAYSIAHAHFLSGSRWADFGWNLWEALLCTGMCVGLLYWFREHVQNNSPLARFAGRNVYGVYLVHLPLLVMVQFALEGTPLGPLTLTILSGVATVLLSYMATVLLRKIPGANAVL